MSSSNPPKNPIVDIASGLGFRPHGYKFDKHDYHAYTIQRQIRLLHTRRGRIAFQYGGVMAWLAREVSDEDFLQQFDDEIYDVGDCLWDEKSPHAYWHDALTDHEIELLCGVYHAVDSDQTSIISWWPKPNSWARGSLDGGWWTPQCEEFFQKRLGHFANEVYMPTTPPKWRHNLKFRPDVKKCWDGYEIVADGIVQGLLTQPAPLMP
ncbi:hypothetical protein K438DRAFT_1630881 [Mycena galopus ATCC 62051]|nr:hypothetical protein K438DRAFT_1630881 [Mycena galopus ATCC 62051]